MLLQERALGDGTSTFVWQEVEAIDPGPDLDEEWLSLFPLRTRGRHVITALGERFRLIGVNWYGASDIAHVVCGLDKQRLDVICASVAHLGFRVVRLPFSNQMLRAKPMSGSIDLGLNPWATGLSALEVYDEVVRCLGRHRVAVIINNHTTFGAWSGGVERNGLWFDPTGTTAHTEDQWIEDWFMLARRYSRCKHVAGYDLRNEVRPSPAGTGPMPLPIRFPTFGDGGQCCWARAARSVAEKLLSLQPDPGALIVVERVCWPQAELHSYLEDPGPLLPLLKGRLVLAVHHYSWSGPGRFIPGREAMGGGPASWCLRLCLNRSNYGDLSGSGLCRKRLPLGDCPLLAQMKQEWGFAVEANLCPVWVSEFGAALSRPNEMHWLERFVTCLAVLDADWCWWPLFAEDGSKPGGEGPEVYGTLTEKWTPKATVDPRLELLEQIGLEPSPYVRGLQAASADLP